MTFDKLMYWLIMRPSFSLFLVRHEKKKSFFSTWKISWSSYTPRIKAKTISQLSYTSSFPSAFSQHIDFRTIVIPLGKLKRLRLLVQIVSSYKSNKIDLFSWTLQQSVLLRSLIYIVFNLHTPHCWLYLKTYLKKKREIMTLLTCICKQSNNFSLFFLICFQGNVLPVNYE